MDWDDARPAPRKSVIVGEDLSQLSNSEMEARLVALAAEIERVTSALAEKRAHEQRAADIFKS